MPENQTDSQIGKGRSGGRSARSKGGASDITSRNLRAARAVAGQVRESATAAAPEPIGGIRIDTWEMVQSTRALRGEAMKALREAFESAEREGAPEEHAIGGHGPQCLAVARVKTASRRGQYPLMMMTPQWRLFVHDETGRARLIMAAEYLAAAGPAQAMVEAWRVAEWLYGETNGWRSTRVDLAADWTALPMEAFADMERVVRRARGAQAHADESGGEEAAWFGARLTGVTLGTRSGAVSAVIYDKSRQVAREGLKWVDEMHAADGWDREARRTRIEFRLRGKGLECWNQHGGFDLRDIETVGTKWQEWAPRVWGYLTTKWLRLTSPPWEARDSNRWRWPTAPEWERVQRLSTCVAERSVAAGNARREEAKWRARRAFVRAASTLAALDERTRTAATLAAAQASESGLSSWVKAFVVGVAMFEADDAVAAWMGRSEEDARKTMREYVDGKAAYFEALGRWEHGLSDAPPSKNATRKTTA